MKKIPSRKGTSQGSAPAPAADLQNLEKGILALLSFLGHSYKTGTISPDLYNSERTAALRNLDNLRKLESEEETEDYDDRLAGKKEKLQKNKHDIESLLSFLEDSYNEGAISEKSYSELKVENTKKLSRINRLISGGYSGESTEVESPSGLYEKFSEPTIPRRARLEDRIEADELEDSPEPEGSISGLPENEFAEAPLPDISPEPAIKPISFKERLAKFSAKPQEPTLPYDDPASDIMRSLNVNPKKTREPQRDFDFKPPADPSNETEKRSGSMLGGIMGKLNKGEQKPAASAATAKGASPAPQSGSAPAQSGGAPSWADKLPEEMTPEELAEYNKAQTDRAADSSGNAPQQEESSPLLPTTRGGGGEESGMSAAEMAKIVLEIEKLKVKVESTEGSRSVMEERIEQIRESIGELRTMLFEKESSTKEQEAKLDKFIEMVSDLEPQRFAKELDKRDRQISDAAFRLEKMETMTGDMGQNLNRVRGMLDAIGSLKNIATVSKDIADRSSKIDNTVSKVERLADETGRVYVELNRKLNEFTLYRGKQDILAESLKELVNMTESMSGKLDNYVSREDMAGLKKDVEDARLMINELQTKLELATQGDEMPPHISDLQEEKEALEQILESNEEEYIEGQIKEDEYKRIKATHAKKLQTIRQKLRDELMKVRKERVVQTKRTEEISQMVEETPVEGAEGSEPANAISTDAQNLEPIGAPKRNAKVAAPMKTAPLPRTPQMPAGAEPSDQAPLEEQEIEGNVGDEQIEQAEETSRLEDELQESEENPEEQEADAEEPEIPQPASKTGPKKTSPSQMKGPASKQGMRQPKGAITQAPQLAGSLPSQKTAAKPPALSLKTEKPLSSKQRIYDLVKSAAEGKRVLITANASTVRKGATQSMIKLEDESGTIYGVFTAPVKGQVVIQGAIAKDSQGVPFIKITKAVNRANLKN
ncbi:MAG: hypothetical protein ABIG96_04915 [Candidatus Micrarchaeota archaeon]